MSKRFAAYTDAELLAITNEDLNTAIRVEAIERGIAPPITISEALSASEWRGYQLPPECVRVYGILAGCRDFEFGWLTQESAEAALKGAVRIERSGWPRQIQRLSSDDMSVSIAHVGVSPAETKAATFKAYEDRDSSEFDAVRDECITKYSEVRQRSYDMRVNSEKRSEYIRLAGGNVDIAKAFWAKVESGEFPSE